MNQPEIYYIIQNVENNYYMQEGFLFNTMDEMKAHRYERIKYAQSVRKNLKLIGIKTRLLELELVVSSIKVVEESNE